MSVAKHVCVLLLIAGCGEHATADVAQREPLALLAETAERSSPEILPGQARGSWAVSLNRSCETCHQRQAREWHVSRHNSANENAAYRVAFSREPSSFCTSCHAPESRDPSHPTTDESALGVGCVSCHVIGDDTPVTVLAAESEHAAADAPHAITRTETFGQAAACAGCHEFRFPGLEGNHPQAFMQTTVSELERIAGAGASCASCHMPELDGRRSHRFDHVRDPAWLSEALLVSAELITGDALELRLSQTDPAHAFPTGDLFRRLEVHVAWLDGRGRVVEEAAEYLARHFVFTPRYQLGRELVRDNRIHAGESVVVLEPTRAESAVTLRWRITLQRVATVGDGRRPETAEIESAVVIHRGELDIRSHVP